MVEQTVSSKPGVPMLIAGLGVMALSVAGFVLSLVSEFLFGVILMVPTFLLGLFICVGLYMIHPNKAAVLDLFGDYRGTDRSSGLRWANPFYRSTKVSLRVRNFTTEASKVNDANGNPIVIAAVVVWKVVDTARATFGVDDFVDYVEIQAESAVRQLARSYPYDSFDDDAVSISTLIGDTGEVNQNLAVELQERADEAGVDIIESRITDLSYAPEIAEAMLRRQQASAIVAARAKIVEGAVWMVRDAIEQLEAGTDPDDAIAFDVERKATFASNLMTVIASDAPTAPVVNVGTLNR